MHYFKLLAISLFIISCSENSDINDMTPSKDVLINKDNLIVPDNILEDVVDTDTLILPEVIEGKKIQHNGYELIIGESTQSEFEKIIVDTTIKLLSKKECIQKKRISITSACEIELQLTKGDYFTLKEEEIDEQFFGYTFKHYYTHLNIYVLWENWLEAGHPIIVNGTTGKITTIFGCTFANSTNQTLTANVAADIGAGWTPNGIQVFEIENDTYYELFEFDPNRVLNKSWGPVDLRWKNDNTIVLECIMLDDKSGYLTLYKVIQFKKIKS
jgi:hypothetical protein